MVYVDELFVWPGKGAWCHMWADSVEELHAFAEKIGVKRCWYQGKRFLKHYDLRPAQRLLALVNRTTTDSPRRFVKEQYEKWRAEHGTK